MTPEVYFIHSCAMNETELTSYSANAIVHSLSQPTLLLINNKASCARNAKAMFVVRHQRLKIL